MDIAATIYDGESVRTARSFLAKPPLFIRLPEDLDRQFRARRQREFERMVAIGAPLGVLVALVTLVLGSFAFSESQYGEAGALWLKGGIVHAVLIVVAALAFISKTARMHYTWVLGAVGIALSASVMCLSLRLSGTVPGQSLTYIFMLVVTLVGLSMRLSLWVAAGITLVGGSLGVLLALGQGASPDYVILIHYFPGSVLVVLFSIWILERQERISFLNAILLAFESAERERLNDELEALAKQDGLTGLANRRSFDDRLGHEWDRTRREQQPLSLLFMDIDHFKAFNDNYGHGQGDECLKAVARTIRNSLLRPGDLAARYGGEEFVALLPATTKEGAIEIAHRILAHIDALAFPHAFSAYGRITLSIGVSTCTPDNGEPKRLAESADQALYRAKAKGRNAIEYQPGLT